MPDGDRDEHDRREVENSDSLALASGEKPFQRIAAVAYAHHAENAHAAAPGDGARRADPAARLRRGSRTGGIQPDPVG